MSVDPLLDLCVHLLGGRFEKKTTDLGCILIDLNRYSSVLHPDKEMCVQTLDDDMNVAAAVAQPTPDGVPHKLVDDQGQRGRLHSRHMEWMQVERQADILSSDSFDKISDNFLREVGDVEP
jgi:hypothetical protein